jgi:predicted molibdopterin-dependent oxidoreductase YjgC
VRQAVGHPVGVRTGWSVLAELCERCGAGLAGLDSAARVTRALIEAVPFYAGLDLETLAGKGARWQDGVAAGRLPAAELPRSELAQPPELPRGLRLGAVPSLWAGPTTEHAPSLRFLVPVQRAELAPADARDMGIGAGDLVELEAGGETVRATAALRQALPPGSVFLVAGTERDNATALLNGVPRTVAVRRIAAGEAGGDASKAASVATGPGARTPPT